MAEFLTTTGVSYQIEQIIKNANDKLVLVSPYLKVNNRFRQLIEGRDLHRIDIRIIYGKSELSPTEIEWINKLQSVKTYYCENLHAKCYYNESQAIVTSMNLYEFSEANNQEMGISFSAASDPGLYEAMISEVKNILIGSQPVALTVQKLAKEEKKSESPKPQAKPAASILDKVASVVKAIKDEGYCIRCKATLPHDPEHPYCRTCYGDWKKEGKDTLSPEKFCHWCGKPNKSTLEKPVDYDCYRKHLK